MFGRRAVGLISAVVGLAVLVACGVLASSGKVGPAELSVFHTINGMPDILAPPMRLAQLLDVLVVGPVVSGVALLLRRWRVVIAALIVTGAKLAGERIVWHTVQRSRPETSISDADVVGGAGLSVAIGRPSGTKMKGMLMRHVSPRTHPIRTRAWSPTPPVRRRYPAGALHSAPPWT